MRSPKAKREARQARAAERLRDRTPVEQLLRLQLRGHGHCAEAKRLAKEITL